MILSILSSILTYELSKIRFIGAIRGSSIMGLIIYALGLRYDFIDATILFGATFVGMCSSNRVNRVELVIATIFYFVALSFLRNYFNGLGGLLGMSSFIGVSTVLLLSFMHKKIRKA